MPYNEVAPIPKQMTIVIGLCVVGLMAFGLALSYYKNILFDRQLLSMQERNDRLKDDIAGGYGQLQYLQSAQYKDKYAKEHLGKLNPGEKILIITESPTYPELTPSTALTPSEQQEAAFQETLRQMPVYQHWELFLFEKEKLDELKRGS